MYEISVSIRPLGFRAADSFQQYSCPPSAAGRSLAADSFQQYSTLAYLLLLGGLVQLIRSVFRRSCAADSFNGILAHHMLLGGLLKVIPSNQLLAAICCCWEISWTCR